MNPKLSAKHVFTVREWFYYMVFKKIIFQNRYVALETPPLHGKNHLRFPFWLFELEPKTKVQKVNEMNSEVERSGSLVEMLKRNSTNLWVWHGWKAVILVNAHDLGSVVSLSLFLSDPSPIIGNACHSLPNWLTNSRLVNLIDVTLACEDANSKLVEVVTVADVSDGDCVGNSLMQIWELMFGHKG